MSRYLRVRVTEDDHRAWERAAEKAGKELSDFVRETMNKAIGRG